MDEREGNELSKKLDQHEKLISRIDFRIKVLQKKRKDVTLDMMVEIVRGSSLPAEPTCSNCRLWPCKRSYRPGCVDFKKKRKYLRRNST